MISDSGGEGWRALFWSAFRQSKNAMLLVDFDRRLVEVNRAGLELLGYAREEIVGRRLDLFLEPAEWASIEPEWQVFQRRGEFHGERALIRADGRAVAVQYAARWARVGARDLALYVALHAETEPLRLDLAAELPPAALLTPREREVVGLVAMGHRAHEIADELGVAESTVRSHIRNAMRKGGARSQAQLVALVCTGAIPTPSLA